MRVCPMCGQWVGDAVAECSSCGETFAEAAVRDSSLGKVRLGIGLLFVGLLLLLATLAGGLGFGFLAVRALDVDKLAFVVKAVAGAYIAATVMMLIGKLLCLAVPSKVGATGIVYTAVGIDVINIGLQIAVVAGALKGLPKNVEYGTSLAGVVGAVLFVLFLKRLSNFVDRPDLAKTAVGVLTRSATGVGLMIAAYFVVAYVHGIVGVAVFFGGALMLVIAFIYYIVLLGQLMFAIKR